MSCTDTQNVLFAEAISHVARLAHMPELVSHDSEECVSVDAVSCTAVTRCILCLACICFVAQKLIRNLNDVVLSYFPKYFTTQRSFSLRWGRNGDEFMA